MTDAELNLELLKLCYRHDRSEDEIIYRACKLQHYVLSSGQSVDSNPEKEAKKPRTDKAKAPV